MKKLKLKLQGLQKKKGAVAEDEVGLLGMYSVLSPWKLCCKSKVIDSERLKCTNGMENFFCVICVEALVFVVWPATISKTLANVLFIVFV